MKRKISPPPVCFFFYMCTESQEQILVQLLPFPRPRFINRITYLTFLNLNWVTVYWCCWFLLDVGCPGPGPERVPWTGGGTTPDLFYMACDVQGVCVALACCYET